MLADILSTCGLSDNEQHVLLFLLKRGSAPAGIIARALELKRPTVYLALERLRDLGIVSKKLERNIANFSAPTADSVVQILGDQSRRRFENERSALELLAPLLLDITRTSQKRDFHGYEVEVYESAEAMYRALDEGLSPGEYRSMWDPQIACADRRGKMIAENFIQKVASSNSVVRDLVVAGPMSRWYRSKITSTKHQVKELPPGTVLKSDMNLVAGSIIFAHYVHGEELAIRIRHQSCYETLKFVFDQMWKQ